MGVDIMETLKKLQGGDLRSIGKADEVVADILEDDTLFNTVFDGMTSTDPVVRMRAADAIEKVTRVKPNWLSPFKKKLIVEVSQVEQQEVQWHVAQMFSRMELEAEELKDVAKLLGKWIESTKSNIVKVNSIQCLYDLSLKYPDLKPTVIEILQIWMTKGSPAVVNRVKKLLRTGSSIYVSKCTAPQNIL
jgi:hypothetical protein